jgi:hypothetical protein
MDDATMTTCLVAMMVMSTISACFGLKRRVEAFNFRSQAFDHFSQHVIVRDANPTFSYLKRHMAVAQMIGDAHQIAIAGTCDVQDLLRLCANDDDATVVRLQVFAITKNVATLQKQSDFLAVGQRRTKAAFLTLVDRKHQLDVVSRLCANSFRNKEHDQNRK